MEQDEMTNPVDCLKMAADVRQECVTKQQPSSLEVKDVEYSSSSFLEHCAVKQEPTEARPSEDHCISNVVSSFSRTQDIAGVKIEPLESETSLHAVKHKFNTVLHKKHQASVIHSEDSNKSECSENEIPEQCDIKEKTPSSLSECRSFPKIQDVDPWVKMEPLDSETFPLVRDGKKEISEVAGGETVEDQTGVFPVALFQNVAHSLDSEGKQNLQTANYSKMDKDGRQCKSSETSSSAVQTIHLLEDAEVQSEERPFPCLQCSRAFTRAADLKVHSMIHSEYKPFKCAECPSSFKRKAHLKIHSRIHSGEKPYLCSECGSSFKSGGELLRHQKAHSEEKPFQCTLCLHRFKTERSLRIHTRIHTGEKPYVCGECGEGFRFSSTLKYHITKVHSGEKPFQCLQCSRAFTSAAILYNHTITHSEKKPFKCGQCGSSFKTKALLKAHTGTHSGEKPHQCLECGSTFRTASKLRNHVRTHSNEKSRKSCPAMMKSENSD